MNYVQLMTQWFNTLPMKRKTGLLGALILILITTVLLCYWALNPSYAILFNQLDEQDANKVVSHLEQNNISYQLDNNGSDILIPKNMIGKTRLKIMGAGLQLAGNVGFELFDKNDFGMTDFSQKINYQRALQGELERTISSLDEVRQARVHLVIPESHLFSKEKNQPKAAVTLHLKQGLRANQVKSIQQLIAASVAHLSVKNVIIVDQNGITLSQQEKENNLTTHLESKKYLEHYLNQKVIQLLHPIFSKNQLMVTIDVAINYDELQRELIKPQKQGQITHEKEMQHSILGKKGKNKNNLELTREKTYELGSEKEFYKRASGTIERLSVSVVLPENTPAQTLIQVQRLVKSAVGFNEKRGDIINIEALIGTRIDSVVPPIPTVFPKLHSNTNLKQPLQSKNLLTLSRQNGKTQWIIVILLSVFFAASSTGTLLIKHTRQKKRQLLLAELSHWLNHHE